MSEASGCLVLETGEIYTGRWIGEPHATGCGEVVFNTSHSGYEEIATDPSYFHQIMVFTAPQQGNYGTNELHRESEKIWIEGAVCLEMQDSPRDSTWVRRLSGAGRPILSDLDTRALVIRLRTGGSVWGSLHSGPASQADLLGRSRTLIQSKKSEDKDWCSRVCLDRKQIFAGANSRGPKVAVIDFGMKNNILSELKKRCSEVAVFPSQVGESEIRKYNPDGILLSNGPGDPADVRVAVDTVRRLLGWKFVFGICMGHQILGLALGAQTSKLKFGHRGANHPIQDKILNRVYVTSQNHGYVLNEDSLPKNVQVTHINLNDSTVAGVFCPEMKALGVQFHPESHPGPHDAEGLFDYFVRQLL